MKKTPLIVVVLLSALPFVTHAQDYLRPHFGFGITRGVQFRYDAHANNSWQIGDTTDRTPDWAGPRDFSIALSTQQAGEWGLKNATSFSGTLTLPGNWQRKHSFRFGYAGYWAPVPDSTNWREFAKRRYFAALVGGTYAPYQNSDLTLIIRYGAVIGVQQGSGLFRQDLWQNRPAFGPDVDVWLNWSDSYDSSWGVRMKLTAFFSATESAFRKTTDVTGDLEIFRYFHTDFFGDEWLFGLCGGLRYDSQQVAPFFGVRLCGN